MTKIKVEALTDEAFAPFGIVLKTEGREHGGAEGLYKWYEKQASVDGAEVVSINLLTAIARDFVCKEFESHERTTETILPLTGGLIVAGVPSGEVSIDRLRAFYIPVGMGICWAPGSWHYAPYPIGRDETCAIIFRHGTGNDDVTFDELPEEVGFYL